MNNKIGVPDAWDDDWVNVADKPENKITQPESVPKLSKAERRAQHLEQQKQIWDTAENPGRKLWLEAQGVEVANQQPFSQPKQLLSRKPPTIAKKPGLEDDEDSEEERRKKQAADLEERQIRAKLEREEKQRRYAEARERIMGSSNPSPAANYRDNSQARRARGNKINASRRSQPDSPAEPSPTPPMGAGQTLFDPEDMSRRLMPKRETTSSASKEDQPLRQPRGPSNNGRGGFGFIGRGGSQTSV